MSTLFDQLEARWQRAGAPIAASIGGPVGRETIVRALAEIDIPATAELLAWFGWHGGPGRSHGGARKVMGVGGDLMDHLSLNEAVEATQMMREVVREVSSSDREGRGIEYYWPVTLFALTSADSGAMVAIETHPRPGQARVLLHEKGVGLTPIASGLDALLERWIAQIDTGYVAWSATDGWYLTNPRSRWE